MKLLFVNCCITQHGEKSRTMALARAFLDAYQKAHPEDEICEEDIREADIPCFDEALLEKRDALMQAGCFEDPLYDYARRFQEADRILVAAPLWDLLFPARLRAYIEHISANGLCYHYDEKGSHGDCRAKSLTYLTSGGDFEQELCAPAIFWKQLCGMFGIENFHYVFAGGVDISPLIEQEQMAKALDEAARLGQEG